MQTPWLPRSLTIFWLGQPTREMERIWGAAGSGEDFQVGDGGQPLCGIVPDFAMQRGFLLQIFPPQLHCPGKARDLGRGFGAGPEAALLPAAGSRGFGIRTRGPMYTAPMPLGPPILWAEMVRKSAPAFWRSRGPSKSPGPRRCAATSVGFHRQAPGDLSDGIDVSQLVVHQHAGHQRRVLPDGVQDLLRRGSRPGPGQDTSPRIPAAPSSGRLPARRCAPLRW